ncbi:VF530 family DNA-binding protein [Acidovorax sp. JHL-9]|uniref:VF530 family protein n=1 Tax=Acidovorax sp. JHL-9 TaxID=1276756 RepID=UPI0005594A80|nr:VF530 family protein [Acidovorax sp. JHL-9]
MNAPASPPTPAPDKPAADIAAPPGARATQAHNPLHGVTLEAMVVALADYFGWQGLGERIPVRCFQSDPSVSSSLKFLRKTPWARAKVESLYLFMLREQRRKAPDAP